MFSLPFPSSAKTLSGGMPHQLPSLTIKISHLSLTGSGSVPFKTMQVVMGCPRISPGGITKRKWRTLQAKKAKKLHEDGLAREDQIYRRRKRAELRAADIELQRPRETIEKESKLVHVSAVDEQLEGWFHKPGVLDLLSDSGLPRSGFCPEGVSHSVYGKMGKIIEEDDAVSFPEPVNGSGGKSGLQRKGHYKNLRSNGSALDKEKKKKQESFLSDSKGRNLRWENQGFEEKD